MASRARARKIENHARSVRLAATADPGSLKGGTWVWVERESRNQLGQRRRSNVCSAEKASGEGWAAGLARTSGYTGDDRLEKVDVSPFQSEESSLFFVLSDEDGDDASFFSSWSDGFFPA